MTSAPQRLLRVVVDLGNSRLKWGRLGPDGDLTEVVALPTDDPAAWSAAPSPWGQEAESATWAISSVNPPVAERLAGFLRERSPVSVRWFRSAADVPVPHEIERPERAGADRALAALAASKLDPTNGTRLVISCGTAITV